MERQQVEELEEGQDDDERLHHFLRENTSCLHNQVRAEYIYIYVFRSHTTHLKYLFLQTRKLVMSKV